jgi:rubrerythrin
MDQTLHTPETYDYRRYDRIWQRVSPTLEPYPAAPEDTTTALTTRQEAQLPGADINPCCLGSAAMEMLEVLTGYIEEELADQRYYTALLRRAPAWAQPVVQRLAEEEGRHAKRLMAVYYLITGKCYCPAIPCGCIRIEHWCPALRQRYHAEACGALNYARSADETTDICLKRIFTDLSQEEYRHADTISRLLERSLHC